MTATTSKPTQLWEYSRWPTVAEMVGHGTPAPAAAVISGTSSTTKHAPRPRNPRTHPGDYD
jgi:hypothetical protein